MWPQISGILDFGDFGFWIWICGFGSWGFWILGILVFGDFGFWILDRYVANLYVRPPTPQIWGILDFGDFGFWGFWILDVGDFGFWSLGILDFGFCDKFWILHKKKKTVHADPGRRILCWGFRHISNLIFTCQVMVYQGQWHLRIIRFRINQLGDSELLTWLSWFSISYIDFPYGSWALETQTHR